jgi:hypothetical protein
MNRITMKQNLEMLADIVALHNKLIEQGKITANPLLKPGQRYVFDPVPMNPYWRLYIVSDLPLEGETDHSGYKSHWTMEGKNAREWHNYLSGWLHGLLMVERWN